MQRRSWQRRTRLWLRLGRPSLGSVRQGVTYPLGGKKGGGTPAAKGAKGNFGGKSKGKAGKQFGKTSSSGPGCLICGSGSHFYRNCPQWFKGGPGGAGSKGFKGKGVGKAYWAEPVYNI